MPTVRELVHEVAGGENKARAVCMRRSSVRGPIDVKVHPIARQKKLITSLTSQRFERTFERTESSISFLVFSFLFIHTPLSFRRRVHDELRSQRRISVPTNSPCSLAIALVQQWNPRPPTAYSPFSLTVAPEQQEREEGVSTWAVQGPVLWQEAKRITWE